MMSWFLITLVIVASLWYLWLHRNLRRNSRFWLDKGILGLKPRLFFGNIYDVISFKTPLSIYYRDLYRSFPDHQVVGFFIFNKPAVLVRDPELVKYVLIKDFGNFTNRGMQINSAKIEPIVNQLFTMRGEEWKNNRAKLSATFTSGKLKLMFPLMRECADELVEILSELSERVSNIFEAKEMSRRFTTDVIASCAFGFCASSLKNPDSEFLRIGQQVFEIRYQNLLRFLFPNIPQFLVQLFDIKIVPSHISAYFENIVRETVEYREKNGVRRNDFLDLLIDLRNNYDIESQMTDDRMKKSTARYKGSKNSLEMTPREMTAHAFVFFTAGLETTSTAISLALLELAQNEIVQLKLREEIDSVLKSYGGIITYESLQCMEYLDMVISETLRKHPPATIAIRQSAAEYRFPNTDLHIPSECIVVIPIFGLHTDRKYYPHPEIFNPENFSKEEKKNRPHCAYIPFGEGPRMCIAERFAQLEVKLALAKIIKEFEITLTSKNQLPLKLKYQGKQFGLLGVENDLWLKCSKINRQST